MQRETIEYLQSQFLRMNYDHQQFVRTMSKLPDGAIISKTDERIAVNLYVWLHSTDGDIYEKKIHFLKPTPKRFAKRAKKSQSRRKFYLSR